MLHHSPFPPLPPLSFTCLPFLVSPAPHYTLPPPLRPPSLASWLMICQVKVRHRVWHRGHVCGFKQCLCCGFVCVFVLSLSLYICMCVCVFRNGAPALLFRMISACSYHDSVIGGWSWTRSGQACVHVHVSMGNLKNNSNNYTLRRCLIHHQNLHNSPPECKCISCVLSGIVLKTLYTVQMWCVRVCMCVCKWGWSLTVRQQVVSLQGFTS